MGISFINQSLLSVVLNKTTCDLKDSQKMNRTTSFALFVAVFCLFVDEIDMKRVVQQRGRSNDGAIHVGPCPDISDKIVSLPDLSEYMGVWYEIERLANFEVGQECVFATYTLESGPNGTYVKVNNTGLGRSSQEYTGIVGKAIQPYPPLAALIVSFAGYPSALTTKPNYNIIALDTSSYALIYVCDDLKHVGLGSVNAWILAREPTLDASIVDSLRANLTSLGVDVSKMHIDNQSPSYCPANN